jgi:predicted nucleic acid-binding protein
MTFIDTGYLIGLINPSDELHARAVEWSGRVSLPVVSTDYVFLEVLNYFSATPFRIRAHEVLHRLATDPAFELVHVETVRLAKGMELHRRRADKDWSLTDCVSFILMEERGMTSALAYDRHFEQAGYESLLRRDP